MFAYHVPVSELLNMASQKSMILLRQAGKKKISVGTVSVSR